MIINLTVSIDLRPLAHKSTQGLLERNLKAWAQQLCRAFGADDHIVFAAQTEFAGDVDARLIGKSHSRFKNRRAAAHQVRMFVAIQPDAVTQAMREVFVSGSVACAGDYRAG